MSGFSRSNSLSSNYFNLVFITLWFVYKYICESQKVLFNLWLLVNISSLFSLNKYLFLFSFNKKGLWLWHGLAKSKHKSHRNSNKCFIRKETNLKDVYCLCSMCRVCVWTDKVQSHFIRISMYCLDYMLNSFVWET